MIVGRGREQAVHIRLVKAGVLQGTEGSLPDQIHGCEPRPDLAEVRLSDPDDGRLTPQAHRPSPSGTKTGTGPSPSRSNLSVTLSPDLYFLRRHALDAAHHPEALFQVDEDDVVGVVFPPVHGRRRVDDPPARSWSPRRDRSPRRRGRVRAGRKPQPRNLRSAGSRACPTPGSAGRPRRVARHLPGSSHPSRHGQEVSIHEAIARRNPGQGIGRYVCIPA